MGYFLGVIFSCFKIHVHVVRGEKFVIMRSLDNARYLNTTFVGINYPFYDMYITACKVDTYIQKPEGCVVSREYIYM